MQNSMTACPHCGAQNSAKARFCKVCGKSVAAPMLTGAPRPAAPPGERQCPVCGATLSETAKFCKACGTSMAAPVGAPREAAPAMARQCSTCGAVLLETAKFCKTCGAAVTMPSSARQPLPARPGVRPPTVPPRAIRFSPRVMGLVAIACVALVAVGAVALWLNRASPPSASPPQFTLGPTRTYAVTAAKDTRITDSVTGHTLRFPEGGSGNVQIASITSGPAAPFEGESVHIEYQGTAPIQLMFKDPGAGAKMVVMGYGFLPGAYVENQWIALPQGEIVDGLVTVDLVMPFELSVSASRSLIASLDPWFGLGTRQFAIQPPTGKKVGFFEYHIAKLTPTSTEGEQVNMIAKQIVDNVQRMLDTLPASIQHSATANRDRLSPFEVDPYVFGKGNNYIFDDKTTAGTPYYTGFGGVYGNRFPQPIIHINPKDLTLAQSLAHETGHYMTHILVGDEPYKTLEAQTPLIFDTDHFIGKPLSSRQSFYLEEPAYFAEYFLSGGYPGGLVGGDAPEGILGKLSIPAGSRGGKGEVRLPKDIDYPTLEGFGFSLLASLVREDATIPVIGAGARVKTDFPAVGLSFGEVFEIISQGATNVNQLREHIETYLKAKGKADYLPIIAQRIGWRYQVKGRLLDIYGDPVEGFKIESIARVNCREYKGGVMRVRTVADGEIVLDEVFPGDSILRVTGIANADGSQAQWDIPIKIDWENPTNQVVDLGDLKLGRMQMYLNGTLNPGPRVYPEGATGQNTFKAVAIGIPPTVKKLQWDWSAGQNFEIITKDSAVLSTETSSVEFVIPADTDSYWIDVTLWDMTCGKQALDMGHMAVVITGGAPPAAPTEAEAPAGAEKKATPTDSPPPPTQTPTAIATPSGTVEQFFTVWSTGAAYNGATAPTTFTIDEAWQVTEILTYHWNEAQGTSAPGTIGLKAADGTVYGPWAATGQDGQGGVPNAAWVVHPNIVIPSGAYTVLDSDPATWSQNEETGGAGMAWGYGIRQGHP